MLGLLNDLSENHTRNWIHRKIHFFFSGPQTVSDHCPNDCPSVNNLKTSVLTI